MDKGLNKACQNRTRRYPTRTNGIACTDRHRKRR